jgi:hypothetical protein
LNAERLKFGFARGLADIAEHGEAALRQIGRHGAAHVAEPDEAYALRKRFLRSPLHWGVGRLGILHVFLTNRRWLLLGR